MVFYLHKIKKINAKKIVDNYKNNGKNENVSRETIITTKMYFILIRLLLIQPLVEFVISKVKILNFSGKFLNLISEFNNLYVEFRKIKISVIYVTKINVSRETLKHKSKIISTMFYVEH